MSHCYALFFGHVVHFIYCYALFVRREVHFIHCYALFCWTCSSFYSLLCFVCSCNSFSSLLCFVICWFSEKTRCFVLPLSVLHSWKLAHWSISWAIRCEREEMCKEGKQRVFPISAFWFFCLLLYQHLSYPFFKFPKCSFFR